MNKQQLMDLLGFKEIVVFHYGEITTEDNELYALEKVAEFYKTMPNFIKNSL
jgi:DNA replication protein DnaD